MKKTNYISKVLLGLVGLTGFSQAAITLQAEYRLGESGSMSGALPQDTSGNGRNFTNAGGSPVIGTAGVSAPGSTHYLDTSAATNDFLYGANFNALPTDNFAFGLYARAAANTAATQGIMFTLGQNTGYAGFSLSSGGWAASVAGVAWVGPAFGTGFVANEWAHLAFIRSNGVSTFYINGVAQTGTTTAVPTHTGVSHMSTNPGATLTFDGLLDEARVVSFTPDETTTNILNSLNFPVVPEPSTALLGSLGVLALLRRRR